MKNESLHISINGMVVSAMSWLNEEKTFPKRAH